MDFGRLERVKTQMRVQKTRGAVGLQLCSRIKKFRRDTVGGEKAEVATVFLLA
jgi:hypothetical protein